MNKDEYLKRIIAKDNKKKIMFRVSILLPLIFLILVLLLVGAVLLANIPAEVREYLLYVGPANFKNNDLEQLLINATGSSNQLIILLLIYWFFIFLVSVFPPIGLFCILIFYITLFWRREDRAIIAVSKLKEIAKNPVAKPNMIKRFAFTRLLFDLELDTRVIPLKRKWYKNVKYQWFLPQAIRKRERNIVYVVSNYESALSQTYKSTGNLLPFLPSLETLETFLILNLNREKNKSRKRINLIDTQETSEIDLLDSFARMARPVVVKTITTRKLKKEKRDYSNWLNNLLAYRTMLYASVISVIAGVIMLIGYYLFEIDASQAFITWFTVTFGVLSITVGIKTAKKDQE
jgi:hypothetical protein